LKEGGTPGQPGAPLLAVLRGLTRTEVLSAGAILLVGVNAWSYIATLPAMAPPAAEMPDMPGMDMGGMSMGAAAAWTWARALATFAMWSVMMAAMMLPAAAPIVLLHRRTALHAHAQGAPAPPTALLVLGYALVWTAFAALATALQWALSKASMLTNMDALSDRRIAGVVLIAAGLYQVTPFKQACLQLCRAPVVFLMRHYQPGATGALQMGMRHGLYCLGCCWAAMALLFVGGVMNLVWVAGLAIFVVIEKTLPFARTFSVLTGIGALAVGLFWLATGASLIP